MIFYFYSSALIIIFGMGMEHAGAMAMIMEYWEYFTGIVHIDFCQYRVVPLDLTQEAICAWSQGFLKQRIINIGNPDTIMDVPLCLMTFCIIA